MVEEQVPHSTALHARIVGRGNYVLGPLARHALNRDRLSPLALDAAESAGLESGCRNPFKSLLVRSVEMLYAADEALQIIAAYAPPEPPAATAGPPPATAAAGPRRRAGCCGTGTGSSADGRIAKATIVPRPRRTWPRSRRRAQSSR